MRAAGFDKREDIVKLRWYLKQKYDDAISMPNQLNVDLKGGTYYLIIS
jgi:hypothetical protein